MTHFQHLAKLQCKITTRILKLMQQPTEYFYHQKNLSCFIFDFPPPRLPHSALVTTDLFSVSTVFISRMLHKWNCTVCKPWRLAFSLNISLEIHPGCCMYQVLVPLYWWIVHGTNMPVCVTIHFWRTFAYFSFQLLQTKLLWTFK